MNATTTQQKLAESEERFRLLSESSLEGIVLSENYFIVDANEQFVKMFGYSSQKEMLGINIVEQLVHPKYKEIVINRINESHSKPYELSCIKKDGSAIIVISKGRVIPYHGRNIRISVLRDVTQEKEYERNLKASEQRYRHLFENNIAAIFRSEVNGNISQFNQAFVNVFGYDTLEEMQKVKAQDLYFSLSDRQRYLDTLSKNGFVKNYQMRMKKKDGSEIWIMENVQLIKDQNTGNEFIEGTLIDITETKQIQQKLQESEENYRSLIEHTPDGILIHDEKGNVVFANPSSLKMLGLSSLNEVDEKNLFSYVSPEYHDKIRFRKIEMSKGKESPFVEIKIKRPDGKIVEAEFKASQISYHGQPTVEVVLHDISLQRQLEREHLRYQLEEEANRELKREIAAHIRTRQRLNANQKYIRLLLDSSIDTICACDKEGRITEFNQAAQKTFGYSATEIINKDVAILFNDPDQCGIIKQAVLEDGNFMGEAVHLKKNKEIFPGYISASLLKDEKGETLGIMSISRDITRIKEAEDELKKSLHEKEILLKEIHHRVKNNLQVISSILKLQCSYIKDKNTITLLNECRDRIASMAFVHATLYMTRDFANINLSEYIANLARNLYQSYFSEDKKISLKLNIPQDYLHIDDAIPCGLIINELLSNSFKYAFVKKKKGVVEILMKVKKENIILVVSDDGIGFPQDTDYQNTATLGLQLVQSLVEQLKGKIRLESKKNKGTKFIIAFKKNS